MQRGTMIPNVSATELLREDHAKVKMLFQEFEQVDDDESKRQIVSQAVAELRIHTMIEEEIFYPAVRQELGDDELVEHSQEEHEAAKELITELEDMEPGDVSYDEKFRELAREVEHHIHEEESGMLPQAEEKGMDLHELGREMMQRKQELQEDMGVEMIEPESISAPMPQLPSRRPGPKSGRRARP